MQKNKKVNYWVEMLKTEPMKWFLVAGSVVSIPTMFLFNDAGMFFLPAWLSLFGVASIFVPTSEGFKNYVNNKHMAEARQKTATHLSELISKMDHKLNKALSSKEQEENSVYWMESFKVYKSKKATKKEPVLYRPSQSFDQRTRTYNKMMEHVHSLHFFIQSKSSVFSKNDLDKLFDATVHYLELWLAELIIIDRLNEIDLTKLMENLEICEKKIKEGGIGVEKFIKIHQSLKDMLKRNEDLPNRLALIESSMLLIVDSIGEIYQTSIIAKSGVNVNEKLKDAMEKLKLEDLLSQGALDVSSLLMEDNIKLDGENEKSDLVLQKDISLAAKSQMLINKNI